MKIADFFVKIGLDGASDVSKGLGKVSGSLKELFSMSIQTKLTLAGIAAGLTGAAFNAGKTGAALNAFSKGFGLSAQELQRWQMASEAFNVSGEEMAGTIKGLQDALAEARLGKGFNEVFTNLMIDPSKIKNGFELANILRQRVQSGGVDATRILSSGLLGENVFQAFRQMGDPSKMAPVRKILSDREIQAMQRISVDFSRFSENLKRSLENFIVKNQPVIEKLIHGIERLLETFLKWTTEATEKTGIVKDVVEGRGPGEIALRTSARIGQGMVDLVSDTFKDTASMIINDYKASRILDEADKRKNLIKPKSAIDGKYRPELVEMQQGNTIIQIDYADFTNSNSKAEFASDAKMLATHKAVKGGS